MVDLLFWLFELVVTLLEMAVWGIVGIFRYTPSDRP